MTTKTRVDQTGMVSLIVTLIMMIVISLIILGFGEVARHNQREALDRQLATQAFYAAETGVNDVVRLIGPDTDPAKYHLDDPTDYNSCSSDPAHSGDNFMKHFAASLSPDLTGDNSVAYTCLLVTARVPNITEKNDSVDEALAVPIDTQGTSTDLTFTWTTNDNSSIARSPSDCPTKTTANNFVSGGTAPTGWQTLCEYGILRLDLFDEDLFKANHGATDTDADDMTDSTAAVYFVPAQASGQAGSLAFGGATVIKAHCDDATCKATLPKGLLSNHTRFDARISAIYEPLNNITISGDTNVSFSGAQLLVDSTGRAQDQLKRIQVRIKLSGDAAASVPVNALQSGDALCKRFLIFGTPGSSARPNFDDSVSPLCQN